VQPSCVRLEVFGTAVPEARPAAGGPAGFVPVLRVAIADPTNKCHTLVALQFTWDPTKARSNLKKHGVSFEEAVTVFADPLALFVEETVHPERTVLIGQSNRGRILFTVFFELEEDVIRIISSRRATAHERRRYEEGEL
jgi:uncharacterized DUF497 family protein